MLKGFLEEVVVIVAGKSAEPIADLLYSKKHENEFLIAKKLDLTINQTRNILYKISDFGLVSSIRKKDKKKGWYTYFWKIEVLKALEFLKAYVEKRMAQFENQINSRETRTFYVCERCNLEFNEENAMHQEFLCPECGEVLSLKDNSKLIRELRKNYDKLKEKLDLIDEEIQNENEKLDKEREKVKKKLEKEKTEKRKLAAKKRVVKKKISKKKPTKKKVAKKGATKKTGAKKVSKKKTAGSRTKSLASSARNVERKKKTPKKTKK